jgi:hypothetical protein
MDTYITWQQLKDKVDASLKENMRDENTYIYKIDLHEDRDDENLVVLIADGIEILC